MQFYAYSGQNMDNLVKVYKTLADESRLRVLNLLLERECCVCEVMQALNISQSKASRILGMLRDAGIATVNRDGLWALYSLDFERLTPEVKAIIEATAQSFAGNAQMANDRERLRAAERVGPGCAAKICGQRRSNQ